ncbi:MAG: amino acid permease [Candidatus Omnitrophica bacterium]|nr:amino acid permease [Candidatus Omnitrophota bacterium]
MITENKLGLWDVFCMATGAMISSGLFVLPALAYRYGGPSIVISYVLAGVLVLPSVLSKAELISAMPKAGGTYFFIERSFGPISGTFSGFANWFSISLKGAFALVGMGAFLEYFFPNVSYMEIKIAAAIFCVFFMLINVYSVKASLRVNNLMVVFLLGVCALYVVGSFIVLSGKMIPYEHISPFMPGGLKGILSVAGMVFISYGGLTKIATIAEEVNKPSKTIPKAMFISFFVVQTIYVLCVIVTIGLLSPKELGSTLIPLTHGGLKMGGMLFGGFLSLAALVAFITTANAGIVSSSRVPLAMAKDGLLPSRFSTVSSKRGVPYFSIIVTGFFMLTLILFLDLDSLVKTASTLMIILFMYVNLSVIIMRESKIINYRPLFRAPLYPWLQIIAIIAYGFLIYEMGYIPLLIAAIFIGLSLLWNLFYVRNRIKRQSALMHLVERVTAKEFVDTSLEEELKKILHKRDNVIKDRFDSLIENCPVLDIEESMERDEFFDIISDLLAKEFDIKPAKIKKLLIAREEESHTVIDKGLAIPHIVIPGKGKFEVIVVRAQKGIIFSVDEEPVNIIFVLAGSHDERNFHLRSLMAIANIVKEPHFYKQFTGARNDETLRILILSSTRKRHKNVFNLHKKRK